MPRFRTLRVKVALFIVFSWSVGPLLAQEAKIKRPIIVSSVISSVADGENRGLSSLFFESLKLELRLVGIDLSVSDTPDVLVKIGYRVQRDTIQYGIEAEISKDKAVIFSELSREQLRFNLDSVLLDQAHRLSAAIKTYETSHSDIFGPEEAKRLPAEEPVIQTASPEKPPLRSSAVTVPQERTGLVFAADLGFFLAAGDAGRYFKTGIWPLLFGGYAVGAGRIVGLSVGAMYFQAVGYSSSADGFVVNAGPDFRFKMGVSGPLTPGFRVCAGGALFIVNPPYGTALVKAVPAAELGTTLDFAIRALTFQFAMDVSLFYEDNTMLYGFTPRLGMEF